MRVMSKAEDSKTYSLFFISVILGKCENWSILLKLWKISIQTNFLFSPKSWAWMSLALRFYILPRESCLHSFFPGSDARVFIPVDEVCCASGERIFPVMGFPDRKKKVSLINTRPPISFFSRSAGSSLNLNFLWLTMKCNHPLNNIQFFYLLHQFLSSSLSVRVCVCLSLSLYFPFCRFSVVTRWRWSFDHG